jgi:hypothetical protein
MALTQIPIELSSTPGIVDNSNDTAITIDSSENVLVGTTDAAPGVGNTNTGGAFGSNGYGVFSRTGAAAQATAYFNKNTNDGTIVALNKDGTAVGSIGTASGVTYFAGPNSSTGGFRIDSSGANGVIVPTTTTGANRDAATDLGYSSIRFRDLYLSGGVVFPDAGGSGTSSSNTLDSYEEGTWTPTINVGTFSYDYATYVKIGRLVHVSFVLSDFSNTTATTIIQVGGLPFTSSSTQIATGGCFHRYFVASGYTDNATIYHADSTSYFRFYWSGTGNWKAAAFEDFSSTSAYIYGSYSYYANA